MALEPFSLELPAVPLNVFSQEQYLEIERIYNAFRILKGKLEEVAASSETPDEEALPSGKIYFGVGVPSPSIGQVGDYYLDIHSNTFYARPIDAWTNQQNNALSIGPSMPALGEVQRGFILRTGQHSDPTVVDAYISLG